MSRDGHDTSPVLLADQWDCRQWWTQIPPPLSPSWLSETLPPALLSQQHPSSQRRPWKRCRREALVRLQNQVWWAAEMSHPDVCLRGEGLRPEPEEEAGSSTTDTRGRGRRCRGHLPPGGGAPGRWVSKKCLLHLGPRGQRAKDSLDRAQGLRSDRSVRTGKAWPHRRVWCQARRCHWCRQWHHLRKEIGRI